MAKLATVTRPYAKVLFRVAKAGNLGVRFELVSEMGQTAVMSDMKAVADDPELSKVDVAGIFLSALKSPVSYEAKELVGLLVANKCLPLLPKIATQFHMLWNTSEGAAGVEIISAFPLEGTPLTELVAMLEREFGKKLQIHASADPSLIGGVRVRVGGEALDTSVCARLTQMQSALTVA